MQTKAEIAAYNKAYHEANSDCFKKEQTMIALSQIKIGSRCRKELGDIEALAASMSVHGLLQPIAVDPENRLVAGQRRIEAAKSLGWTDIACHVVQGLDDALGLLAAENDENTCRKDFTWSEAVAMAERLELLEKPKAKERQIRKPICSGKLPEQKKAETREKVAVAVGKKARTLAKAAAVVASGDAALVAKMDTTGKVDGAHQELQKRAKIEAAKQRETAPPDGLYDVAVIDPPWPMEKILRDCRPNQDTIDYPTMTEDELAGLSIPMAKDCHVWLWTTHHFLPMALRLLDRWGLKYVCTFVWRKAGAFQPVGLPQLNCEFALYARKGAPVFTTTKDFFVCFDAARGAHSEKPEEFYAMVRRVTAGRRIDMFNRRKIEGFDAWGNEAS